MEPCHTTTIATLVELERLSPISESVIVRDFCQERGHDKHKHRQQTHGDCSSSKSPVDCEISSNTVHARCTVHNVDNSRARQENTETKTSKVTAARECAARSCPSRPALSASRIQQRWNGSSEGRSREGLKKSEVDPDHDPPSPPGDGWRWLAAQAGTTGRRGRLAW